MSAHAALIGLLIAGILTIITIEPWKRTKTLKRAILNDSVHIEIESNCTNIRLPPKLCSACSMRDFDENGVFQTDFKKDIFDYSSRECQKALRQYVKQNPCDEYHAKHFRRLQSSAFSQRRTAIFLYAVCETCCDCIPVGSREEDYEFRKKNKMLLDPYRGNCAAHFWYDTCKIWPKVENILSPREAMSKNKAVCPELKSWIHSSFSKGWLHNSHASGLSQNTIRVLSQILDRARCKQTKVWSRCARLEYAQKRVWHYGHRCIQ